MVGDEFAKQVSCEEGSKSRTVSVCYKHFPPNCPAKMLPGETMVPKEPPSVFGSAPSSLFSQITSKFLRKPEKRNVTSKVRALKSVAGHTTDTFDGLMLYCNKLPV